MWSFILWPDFWLQLANVEILPEDNVTVLQLAGTAKVIPDCQVRVHELEPSCPCLVPKSTPCAKSRQKGSRVLRTRVPKETRTGFFLLRNSCTHRITAVLARRRLQELKALGIDASKTYTVCTSSNINRSVALRRISKMTPYVRYGVCRIVAFTV
jgi:hypothetical protein